MMASHAQKACRAASKPPCEKSATAAEGLAALRLAPAGRHMLKTCCAGHACTSQGPDI